MSFHSPLHSIHTLTQNSPGVPGVSGGDPPNDPPGDDLDSDFDSPDASDFDSPDASDFDSPDASDAKDTDSAVVFTNLAKTIKSLAKYLCYNPSKTS